MSGIFSPSKQTSTTSSSVQLSPEQKQLLAGATPYVTDFAKKGITLPTGSQIAPFNATQQQAQSQVLANAPKQQSGADVGLGASNWLLSGAALDPNSNPALRGTINAATRPIFEGLSEQILPQIRGEATMTGNYGGSRQGIAEGIASRGALDAAGDAASKISYQGYQSGLDAMNRSLGTLPQTLEAQNTGAMGVGAVGDVNQQMQQTILDEAKAKYLQQQTLPLEIGKELINLVGAIPSAGATNSVTQPGPSLFQSLLGTGLTAAGALGGLGWKPFA